jgi:hypothetical protein
LKFNTVQQTPTQHVPFLYCMQLTCMAVPEATVSSVKHLMMQRRVLFIL